MRLQHQLAGVGVAMCFPMAALLLWQQITTLLVESFLTELIVDSNQPIASPRSEAPLPAFSPHPQPIESEDVYNSIQLC